MLTQILCSCDIPPAGPGPCYSDTNLMALPSSYLSLPPPSISPGFTVGTVLAGTSISSSLKRQQISQDLPLKPLQPKQVTASEMSRLKMRPGVVITGHVAKCRTIWKHQQLGQLQQESLYFLNKWSNLSLPLLTDTLLSCLLNPKKAHEMLGYTQRGKENNTDNKAMSVCELE